MLKRKCLPVLAAVLLGGCAHGFDRDALRERLNDGTLQSPDAAIVEARGLKPQLRFPCRVAVYLKPSGDRDWRWTPEDKAAMEHWAAVLKKEGIAADVFPLPDLLTGKGDVKELRLAAAKCGADALFVIHGAAQTDSYKNFAAVLNLTVVGGYVVPASHKDTLFLVEGVLMDVDNGYVYTGMQAEGVGKIVRPTFVIEERDSIALAKTKALTQFGEEVLTRMRALAAAPPAVKPTPRALVSDINARGTTPGLTPAGTYAPDLGVPIHTRGHAPDSDPPGRFISWGDSRDFHRLKPVSFDAGVMSGITTPKP